MAEVAMVSQVAWVGTFLGILLPGAAAGSLLAVAWARGAAGRTERIAWFGAAPLLFGITLGAGQFVAGLGIMAGGFAIGARSPRWLRMVCAVLASAFAIALVVSVPVRAGMRLAPTSPRGLWVMALSASLVLVAMLATAIPFRYAAAVTEEAGLHSPTIGEGAPPLPS
ncbi:MAG: hypothetical protein H5T81_10255 [Tetrasphaera sp.]|nr:hypothetical protein [Tetrasphaera sp.]